MNAVTYPAWPPGFWRRIVLHPGPGWIGGALEDDVHSFRIRLDHVEQVITAVSGAALRHPWTACPGAVGALRAEFTGARLEDVARHDPRPQCTHLFDLVVLCAAHAGDTRSLRIDMTVADRIGGRTTATLSENDRVRLTWRLDGLDIAGPGRCAGYSLRELSRWKDELRSDDAERALLLRRAVMVSGSRTFDPPPQERAAEQGPRRLGVCYNYQLPQAEGSIRMPDWRYDFSRSDRHPLDRLDPAREFAALSEPA